jgi:hypothetical protein
MDTVGLLNAVEEINSFFGEGTFVDLHILNNSVVGFYKTKVVKYKNIKNEDTSYLFPTTFRLINNKIETVMTFGSVNRNFEIPKNINGTEYGTILHTLSVGNHLYKLLVGRQFIEDEDIGIQIKGFELKSFICIIEALDSIGFPFIRITNNESFSENSY